jgi:hypothetical protein
MLYGSARIMLGFHLQRTYDTIELRHRLPHLLQRPNFRLKYQQAIETIHFLDRFLKMAFQTDDMPDDLIELYTRLDEFYRQIDDACRDLQQLQQ